MNGLHGEVDSVGAGVMEGVGEKVDVGGGGLVAVFVGVEKSGVLVAVFVGVEKLTVLVLVTALVDVIVIPGVLVGTFGTQSS